MRTAERVSRGPAQEAGALRAAAPKPRAADATRAGIGNQAMQRLLQMRAIQAKLTVNTPGDRFEQEADRVAEAVMSVREASNTDAVGMQISRVRVQRMCTACQEREEERVQAKEVPGRAPEVTPTIHAQIEALRSGGRPLPETERAFFEPRFGHDFSQVRIHTDGQAVESTRAVNARAFTLGRDVVFGAGQYSPGTAEGKRVLAHELAHVVQQGHDTHPVVQRLVGPCEDIPTPHRRLIRGSVHPAVREAQRKLNLFHEQQTTAGNPGLTDAPLVEDCIFGQHTFNAVLSFQQHVFPGQPEHHVGQIGDRTWAELDKIRGTPTPTPVPVPPVPPPTPTPALPTPIRTVSIWLNAFIPRDLPGLTEAVPGGPHAGGTMVPGPLPGVSDCFLTDQRGFSNSRRASSRMQSLVDIDVQAPPFSKSLETHRCSPTHEIDCGDGEDECTAVGDTTRMTFSSTTTISPTFFTIDLVGASNNPCFSGSPDITYQGKTLVDLASRTIFFSISIDQFPAFEMYAAVNGGAGVMLFQELPPPGNTPGSLVTSGRPTRLKAGNSTI